MRKPIIVVLLAALAALFSPGAKAGLITYTWQEDDAQTISGSLVGGAFLPLV